MAYYDPSHCGMPAGGMDSQANITLLYNHVIRPHNIQVDWAYRPSKDQFGRDLWLADLYVGGRFECSGVGAKKGHAKDHAAWQYLVKYQYLPSSGAR